MQEFFDIHDNRQEVEQEHENALRPMSFLSFNGQDKILENLKVFVNAASRLFK